MLNVVPETHIQHAIRLIENDHLEGIQLQRPALHVIHHPPRRADDHLRARREGAELALITLPAVDRHLHHAFLKESQFAKLFGNLHGQLPRRAEHEDLHFAQPGIDLLDRGNRKSGGLTRAGRGLTHDVPPSEGKRNDGGLNGRGFLETHLIDCL